VAVLEEREQKRQQKRKQTQQQETQKKREQQADEQRQQETEQKETAAALPNPSQNTPQDHALLQTTKTSKEEGHVTSRRILDVNEQKEKRDKGHAPTRPTHPSLQPAQTRPTTPSKRADTRRPTRVRTHAARTEKRERKRVKTRQR
jgi:hypothetical protein